MILKNDIEAARAVFDGVDDYKQKKDQQINVSPFF